MMKKESDDLFKKFLNKKILVNVSMNSEKHFCYTGIVLEVHSDFITIDDEKGNENERRVVIAKNKIISFKESL